jgi:hypothetical protein
MVMIGAQLGGVLDQHKPLAGIGHRQHARQERCLARAGAAGDEEGDAGRDQAGQQTGAGRRNRAGGHELVEGEGTATWQSQRKAGAARGDRGQHRVQPDAAG